MSLGLGVLLATALVLVAWQADKRKAWRQLGTLVLVLIVLSGLGVLAVRIWTNHKANERLVRAQAIENAKSESIQAQTRDIREGNLQSLAGVTLGQSRVEVEYVYGKPDKDANGEMQWSNGVINRVVVLSKTGNARVILCGAETPYDVDGCGRPAGLSLLVSESAVVRILGLPSKVDFKDAMKIAHYGSNGTLFDVVLAKGRIRRFILSRDSVTDHKEASAKSEHRSVELEAARTAASAQVSLDAKTSGMPDGLLGVRFLATIEELRRARPNVSSMSGGRWVELTEWEGIPVRAIFAMLGPDTLLQMITLNLQGQGTSASFERVETLLDSRFGPMRREPNAEYLRYSEREAGPVALFHGQIQGPNGKIVEQIVIYKREQ